ncbi:unnamed protein product, partial [Mesorhabditis spiculigera]
MPKYYCDYCDTFLTHDSPSVRKTHNQGRKHKENVREFYQKWMEQEAQKLVDATAKAFAAQRPAAMGQPVMRPNPYMPSPMGGYRPGVGLNPYLLRQGLQQPMYAPPPTLGPGGPRMPPMGPPM